LLGFVCLVEECRQSNSRKNTDNDDNYQQFNQRKTFILSSLIEVLQELSFSFSFHGLFLLEGWDA